MHKLHFLPMALMISLVLGSGSLSAFPIMAQEYLDPQYTSDDSEYAYTSDGT
jgi:hypothetical protein